MTDISRHSLLKQAYDVCQEIEKCGASPQLTNAVTKASELLRSLDAFIPVAGTAPATNMAGATGGPLAEKVAGTIDPHFAPTGLDFSSALNWLKTGQRLQRAGWNGAGQWVEISLPDDTAFYSDIEGRNVGYPLAPHFGLKNAQGKFVPGWIPSTGDLMATDWQVWREPLEAGMPPHQLRVLQELKELAERVNKLSAFVGGDVFVTLPEDEQERLKAQLGHMECYMGVLADRVAAFQ